jgi:hypothetical protein
MFWLLQKGCHDFFTFFLITFDQVHHIYNIQFTENEFKRNVFLSTFSSAAPVDDKREWELRAEGIVRGEDDSVVPLLLRQGK